MGDAKRAFQANTWRELRAKVEIEGLFNKETFVVAGQK